jgi:hypothetical protein
MVWPGQAAGVEQSSALPAPLTLESLIQRCDTCGSTVDRGNVGTATQHRLDEKTRPSAVVEYTSTGERLHVFEKSTDPFADLMRKIRGVRVGSL